MIGAGARWMCRVGCWVWLAGCATGVLRLGHRADGSVGDGSREQPDAGLVDGAIVDADGAITDPDGAIVDPDGAIADRDAAVDPDGAAGGGCLIDSRHHAAGEVDSSDGCRVCDPMRAEDAWSPCPSATWRQGWPRGRMYHSMVGLASGGVLLVGGTGDYSNQVSAEVFRFDGDQWIDESDLFATVGPRNEHAMAYDSARDRVVLFGGFDASLPGGWVPRESTTWERAADGRWSVALPDGPTAPEPRAAAAMAFDAARGVVVLFGGRNEARTHLRDTWEYDGAWHHVPTTGGPLPRSQHAMAYDPVRERVVLHGGTTDSTVLGDTWEWDGTAWTTPGIPGPPRRAHGMTFDARLGRAVIAGGFAGTIFESPVESAETYSRDSAGAWQLEGTMPAALGGLVIAHDPARHTTVAFGGSASETHPARTYVLDAAGWSEHGEGMPGSGDEGVITYDSARGEAILFVGTETWGWNGFTWRRASTVGPSARTSHAMAFDPVRGVVVLYGGWSSLGMHDDTWEWDGARWSEIPTSGSPGGRMDHAMAFDAVLGGVLLVGGRRGGTVHRDTWLYDGDAWVSLGSSLTLPEMEEHSMSADDPRSRVVICGGGAYEWDASSWAPLTGAPSGMCASRDSRVAFDPLRDVLVTYGGLDGDSYALTGSTWTEAPGAPPPRAHAAMTGSPRGLVLFGGGLGTSSETQTWVYGHFGSIE